MALTRMLNLLINLLFLKKTIQSGTTVAPSLASSAIRVG